MSGPLVCVWHWADSHTPGPASTRGYFVTLTLCRGHRLQPEKEWAAIGCHSLKKILKSHSRSSRFHLKSRFPVLKDPKGSQRWVDPPRSDNLQVQHLHGARAPESALTLALFLLQLRGHTSIAVTTFPASLGQCEPPLALASSGYLPHQLPRHVSLQPPTRGQRDRRLCSKSQMGLGTRLGVAEPLEGEVCCEGGGQLQDWEKLGSRMRLRLEPGPQVRKGIPGTGDWAW